MSEEKNINSHSLKCKENVWKKFVSLIDEMDNVNTQGQALERLIDVYEEPPKTKILDKEIASQNEDLIKKNQELAEENARLKQQIEELTNSGNDNAMAAQRLQLELDKANETIAALQQESNRPENIFEVEVHPVPFYFLKKMAAYLSNQKKTEITPGYILTDLFLKDLQNPLANNLPYIVTTAEISKVLEEYRKAHPEEK